MTISSKQIFKAIRHYQEAKDFVAINLHIESLIEAMRTGESNDKVLIEEINGLGTGFYVTNHGTYFPTENDQVVFVTSV
mgnify:CR=1 FL=1